MNFSYTRALVRRVPNAYADRYGTGERSVDRKRARGQHRAYVRALEDCGLEVSVLAPAHDQPDSVFVEDPVVVWNGRALIARPPPPRDVEAAALEAFFAEVLEVERVAPPARLEGGDVLHTSAETFVGLSKRTEAGGARRLRRFLARDGRSVTTVEIQTDRYLHLKSGASCLGDGRILKAPGVAAEDVFRSYEVLSVPGTERAAANALRINDTVLTAAGYPRTADLVTDAVAGSVEVRTVDISEFEKGGGSLSCLSVLWG